MRILISGAGVAGPTLAFWLLHYGHEPTLVESAPHLRAGGYIIDFWGAGFDVADRIGLLPEILHNGYQIKEVRIVDRAGRRVAGFPAAAFSRIAHGRYTSLPRGDLAAAIFRKIEGRAEIIFGDSISKIQQSPDCVHVTLASGASRDFDLLVGADGQHSRVRELAFGPESQFEKYLGYKVAAFSVPGYQPRDELVYVMYTQVGQQLARFAIRDGSTMFWFMFADDAIRDGDTQDLPGQKALLRQRFGASGWECPLILDALDQTDDLYFDRVSQIRMDPKLHPQNTGQNSWSRGRVALLGDAASCVSLLAGQGSALAMVAAYILAGELHRARGDYAQAFTRYQNLFGPFVLQKQEAALRFAGAFVPKSKLSLFLRNQIMNLMAIPWVTDMAFGKDFSDKITLPDY